MLSAPSGDQKHKQLMRAAFHGRLDMVRVLVSEAEVSVGEGDPDDGLTPLMAAASQGRLEVVRFLVCEGGASVETRSIYGDTATTLAAEEGHRDIVRFLVSTARAGTQAKVIAQAAAQRSCL